MAYLLAVTLLGFALQPVLAAEPGLALGLQLLAASYLLHAAWRIWHRPLSLAALTAAPVTPRMIAVTTLLNPKTLIIAFGLMPAGWNAQPALALTHLMLPAVTVPLIGGLWLLAGHLGAMKASPRATHAIVPRFSALILTGFAVLLARYALAGW
jgi:threonine/homoserine/homoserine lactone efflux protein